MEDYVVNGIGVGKNPNLFERSKKYTDTFERLGNSAENIKIVNNFVSKQYRERFLEIVKMSSPTSSDARWGREDFRNESLSIYIDKHAELAFKMMANAFEVDLTPTGPASIIKWSVGTEMPMHVDDLGNGHSHISGVIYLNDDYSGGEISFPTLGIEISPTAGDFVMFPGNLNYPHKVNAVTDGTRYTIPVWGDIV